MQDELVLSRKSVEGAGGRYVLCGCAFQHKLRSSTILVAISEMVLVRSGANSAVLMIWRCVR